MKGCEGICDCCPDCCKKYWNKHFNKNKSRIEIINKKENNEENNNAYKKEGNKNKKEDDDDEEEIYKEEKNITQDNFTLEKTLEKLKNNWKTYLLEIFRTRLYLLNAKEKYENAFQDFCENYSPKTFFESLTGDMFIEFYKKVLDNCKLIYEGGNYDSRALQEYKNGLLKKDNTFLIYALLTDGDEKNIYNKIFNNIECTMYSDKGFKENIIGYLIDAFKRQIIETIKEKRKEEIKRCLNKKDEIKKQAQKNYNVAIAGHNEGKITLSFYDQYNLNDVKGELKIAKNVKLSALFNYVLSQGRTLYYFNPDYNKKVEEEEIGDDEIKNYTYVSYDDEKARLVLKDSYSRLVAKILNNAINDNNNITIGGSIMAIKVMFIFFLHNENNV